MHICSVLTCKSAQWMWVVTEDCFSTASAHIHGYTKSKVACADYSLLDTCGHDSRTLYWCPDPGRWLVHKLVNMEMWDKSLNWRYSYHQHWWPPNMKLWSLYRVRFPLRASLRWNCRCICTSLQHEHLNKCKCKSLCSCTVFKEHASILYAVWLKWLFC